MKLEHEGFPLDMGRELEQLPARRRVGGGSTGRVDEPPPVSEAIAQSVELEDARTRPRLLKGLLSDE